MFGNINVFMKNNQETIATDPSFHKFVWTLVDFQAIKMITQPTSWFFFYLGGCSALEPCQNRVFNLMTENGNPVTQSELVQLNLNFLIWRNVSNGRLNIENSQYLLQLLNPFCFYTCVFYTNRKRRAMQSSLKHKQVHDLSENHLTLKNKVNRRILILRCAKCIHLHR